MAPCWLHTVNSLKLHYNFEWPPACRFSSKPLTLRLQFSIEFFDSNRNGYRPINRERLSAVQKQKPNSSAVSTTSMLMLSTRHTKSLYWYTVCSKCSISCLCIEQRSPPTIDTNTRIRNISIYRCLSIKRLP